MCGIIAYSGGEPASPILYEGLKRLEYRGYDSAGIATIDSSFALRVKKGVGKVREINKKLDFVEMEGNIGMAHTRWATHGKVTQKNSHPHFSNRGKIAVVHNGIVENYVQLKQKLAAEGFSFQSETDTEVIPNLIEYWMRTRGLGFVEAVINSARALEGNSAFVAMDCDSGTLVGLKNGSPLVLGIGADSDELFLASDIPAFLDHTKQVAYLYDGDMVVIDSPARKNGTQSRYYISNIKNDKSALVSRQAYRISWDISDAEKGSFDHFLLKEISEQVETIQRAANQNADAVREVTKRIRKARGVFLVGCGSSFHACLSASYLFSKLASFHINPVLASEFASHEHFLTRDSLVIAVSQSGETIDVLDAIRTAKKKGCQVISLVNVSGSSIAQLSNMTLPLNAGPEISVLSTKTYTAQLVVLTLLVYALIGKHDEGLRKLKFLWNIVYNLTAENTRERVKKLAQRLATEEHIFVLGRGALYATALEAALKIKEVSYIHAEAFAGGELKHGSISLISEGTPCIVFVSRDTENKILSNAMELKSRGGYMIGVGPKPIDTFDFFVKVPETEEMNPVCDIIPIQILAYQLAIVRGLDPDRPRNLAKSVTVS